jgi:hypothetical protein
VIAPGGIGGNARHDCDDEAAEDVYENLICTMHDRCDPSQSDFSGITNTHEIFRDAESVFIISQPTEFASPGAAVFVGMLFQCCSVHQ